jgi:formylglycine-generating enzyme required for sulfatase activity
MKDPVAFFWGRNIKKSEHLIQFHCSRGGTFVSNDIPCNSKYRESRIPKHTGDIQGFRIVRSK